MQMVFTMQLLIRIFLKPPVDSVPHLMAAPKAAHDAIGDSANIFTRERRLCFEVMPSSSDYP